MNSSYRIFVREVSKKLFYTFITQDCVDSECAHCCAHVPEPGISLPKKILKIIMLLPAFCTRFSAFFFAIKVSIKKYSIVPAKVRLFDTHTSMFAV